MYNMETKYSKYDSKKEIGYIRRDIYVYFSFVYIYANMACNKIRRYLFNCYGRRMRLFRLPIFAKRKREGTSER